MDDNEEIDRESDCENTPPRDSQGRKITKPKSTGTIKRRSQHRAQKFRKAWLLLPDYKNWLAPVPTNSYKAQCTICNNMQFTAELSVIRNHEKRKSHIGMRKKLPKRQEKMEAFVERAAKCQRTSQQTQIAEIKLSGCLAEHNISIQAIDHLTDLLKECFPDSTIAREMQLKRTKATNIIKYVIGATEKDILTEKLKATRFSILTDESTDISSTKTACIVVRFYDEESGLIVSRFWELASVFEENQTAVTGATAERLFAAIISSFEKRQVPFENIVGFGSDGCNTMMGRYNSVASRFRQLCPGIMIYQCICHSLHLCASEACKALPRTCEDLARNIHNYFKASAKRQSEFTEFQSFMDLKIHRLLHPSQTRWLSLHAVVARVVEQWEALKLYFTNKLLTEKLLSVEQTHHALNDPLIYLFYLFLEWVLPKFVALNKYFQSDKVVIVNLYKLMKVGYTDLLCCYMNRDYVLQTSLDEIDPKKEDKFLNAQSMYLGVKVMAYLNSQKLGDKPDLKHHFFEGCRKFLIIGSTEIKKRFNFADPVLPLLEAFTPIKAMSQDYRKHMPSLLPVMQAIPRVVTEDSYQRVDDEWRQLPFRHDLPINVSHTTDADVFWDKIRELKNGEVKLFSNLAEFALNALVVPHSNAECERVFSKVNLCKTEIRNKLITETVEGLLLTSQHLEKDCRKFKPTNTMMARMTKAALYPQNNESTVNSENDCVRFSGI